MSKEQILSNSKLIEEAVANDEGKLVSNGAFLALTGSRTGRSPKDRFIVEEASTRDKIEWGNVNQPFNSDDFNNLWDKVSDYLSNKKHYKTEVHVGSNKDHYIPVEVKCEKAWHSLFSKLIFIVPDKYNSENKEVWQLISAPDFVCDPEVDKTNSDGCVIINFHKRRVLIAGMKYAGEIKKSMFSVQNFLLPEKNVLPMHCSANQTSDGRTTLFFGLSGTGKTTLSADPKCSLIGDDEHGWGDGTVFNFEGGCYAKCIKLSRENEPLIWDAIKFGSVLENVDTDAQGNPDYDSDKYTENTRCCYPREFIENSVPENEGIEPDNIIFLTCDLSGVLP
ncbi:MAG: phosphoenolpyruvate carboxykinase (ATP), partial [Pseudomonadota bacterium]|nr:phosphoenolpyruvate carboxykinase (ATP) [Pseudomonadota bacterium]